MSWINYYQSYCTTVSSKNVDFGQKKNHVIEIKRDTCPSKEENYYYLRSELNSSKDLHNLIKKGCNTWHVLKYVTNYYGSYLSDRNSLKRVKYNKFWGDDSTITLGS